MCKIMHNKLNNIKLLAVDVDGTLTDGEMVFVGGEQVKAFNVYDGFGIRLAMNYGLEIAFVTGNACKAVEDRAKMLGINKLYQGSRFKSYAIQNISRDSGISLDEIAFIGDDLNDIPAFDLVGVKIAVENAADELKSRADFITSKPGGRGAVREAIEMILKAQGKWEKAIQSFLEMLSQEEDEKSGPEGVA